MPGRGNGRGGGRLSTQRTGGTGTPIGVDYLGGTSFGGTLPGPANGGGGPVTTQIVLSPATLSVLASGSGFVNAIAKDAGGTATGAAVTYQTSDSSVLAVDSSTGAYVWVGAGTATITATVGGVTSNVCTVTCGAAALSLSARIAAAFGGNANVGGIFLHNVGITDDGTGHCSVWQDARGGSYPSAIFAAGARPAIEPTTGYLVFTGAEYGTIGSALITSADNWALMTGRKALLDRGYETSMIAAVGDGSNGFGLTTSTPSGVETEGGLLNGLAWVSSDKGVNSEPMSPDGINGVLLDQTFRRLAGSTTTRQKGAVLGSASSTAPIAPTTISYIGWNGSHSKFKGKLGYVVFVAHDPGGNAMDDAETALFGAYGIGRTFTSITFPATGDWTTMAQLVPVDSTMPSGFTLATAGEGVATAVTDAPSPMTGKSVAVNFKVAGNTTNEIVDHNAGVDYTLATPANRSKWLRVSMRIMFAAGTTLGTTAVQRKLIYAQMNPGLNGFPQFFYILNSLDGVLNVHAGSVPLSGPVYEKITPLNIVSKTIVPGTPMDIVMWLRLETALGRGDGYGRIDIDGVKCHEDFNVPFSQADWVGALDATLQAWYNFRFGCQLDTTETNRDEFRFIQVVKVETAPVPA